MSSKPGQVFPGFGGPPERQKAAGFQRLLSMFGSKPDRGLSEPLGAATVRSTIPVITVAAIAAVAVKIPVPTHFALEPVVAPAFPAPKPGQHGEPALLAVIER